MEYGVFGAGVIGLLAFLFIALFFPVMFLIAFWRMGTAQFSIVTALREQTTAYLAGEGIREAQPPPASARPTTLAAPPGQLARVSEELAASSPDGTKMLLAAIGVTALILLAVLVLVML